MPKVVFSGIGITSMNGSIGNRSITRNAYGAYAKTKLGAPAVTANLTAARTMFQGIRAVWPLLTDAQRQQWIDAAVRTNRRQQLKATMGNVPRRRILMGCNYFVSCNINIFLAGGVNILTPPKLVPLQVPTALNINNGAQLTIGFTTLQANWSCRVYCSAQLSAGRMSNNQTYYSLTTATVGNFLDITIAHFARFGARIMGDKIFIRIEYLNRITGQRTPSLYGSSINP